MPSLAVRPRTGFPVVKTEAVANCLRPPPRPNSLSLMDCETSAVSIERKYQFKPKRKAELPKKNSKVLRESIASLPAAILAKGLAHIRRPRCE